MTEEKVTDRVKREFRYFQLDMLRTSRENIFANSGQIEVKRQAFMDICSRAESGLMGDREEARLEGIQNILDLVYCYYVNEKADGKNMPLQGAYARWLASVGAGIK